MRHTVSNTDVYANGHADVDIDQYADGYVDEHTDDDAIVGPDAVKYAYTDPYTDGYHYFNVDADQYTDGIADVYSGNVNPIQFRDL